MSSFWLIVGLSLCAIELVVPTAFVAFVMGLSAIIVAVLAPVLPQPGWQVAAWMVCSGGLVWVAKRYFDRPGTARTWDAIEAETTTEIPAGRPGRVLYEGQSWQARCEDESRAIAAGQTVYVVGQRGTTLLVMPIEVIDAAKS